MDYNLIIQNEIKQLTNKKNELNENIKLLEDLPKKLEYKVLHSLNSTAFVPATIYHTNEFLVSYGEDIFVKRTASQSIEILKRRIKILDDNIEKQKKIIEKLNNSKIENTNEEDLIEIHEEFNEINHFRKSFEEDNKEETKGNFNSIGNKNDLKASSDFKILQKFKEKEKEEELNESIKKNNEIKKEELIPEQKRPISKFKQERMKNK